MIATTSIVLGADRDGRTVVRRMHCEVPMLVRIVGEPDRVLSLAMVSGAAGPIGGDRLSFRLELEAGARVTVRSVAAALAQPGPRGEHSEHVIDLVVAAGACLDWQPQPVVSVVGSDHRVFVRLDASSTSTVTMREGVFLGRHDEPPGRFVLRERVAIDGVAVLDHETTFAAGALMGPGAQGAARTMTTEVFIGSRLPEPVAVVSDNCLHSTVHLSPICALAITRT